jgi:hypothetical protein
MRSELRAESRALRHAATAALVVAGIALPGCTEVESEAVEGYEPAKLQAVKGSELKQVTLTPEAAKRTGVRMASVRRSGGQRVVPYSALIYDSDGRTYVYVTPKPLSFMRAAVAVDRIEGASALLRDGPPVGSRVVTTGASEVFGTELEVAGSH